MFIGMEIISMIKEKPHIILGVGAVVTGLFGSILGRDVDVVCGAMCAATVLMEFMHYHARREAVKKSIELDEAIEDAKKILEATYVSVADKYPDGGAHLVETEEEDETDGEVQQ